MKISVQFRATHRFSLRINELQLGMSLLNRLRKSGYKLEHIVVIFNFFLHC